MESEFIQQKVHSGAYWILHIFFEVSCRFIQINTFNFMDLCSIPRMLYKIAMHGTNDSIFSGFEK